MFSAGSHDFHHALDEATDLNRFFNLPVDLQPRIWGRAASFCMERSGYNEGVRQTHLTRRGVLFPGHF